MKLIRFTAVILIIILSLSPLAGCGNDYKKAYIYFELNEPPATLDAQTASTDSELLIVRNLYEGLLRKNKSGAIVYGAAKEFKKSGLTYTFTLRSDAVWSNEDETPVTAYDFVFAFKRAVSPKTEAPFASRLFSIANAKAIYEGRASADTLGVIASDKNTLIITLEREDPYFEDTLTTSVCMPCNEEFFNKCVGKYGLESKYTISNGSYSITKWNKDVFGIRLYKNDYYNGTFEADNAAVFISCGGEESPLSLLKEDNVDITFLGSQERAEAEKNGFSLIEYQNICWVITIGKEYSESMRKCFALAFSSDIYSSSLPSGFAPAKSLYPEILGVSSADSVGLAGYDIEASKRQFSAIVSGMENKKFPPAMLYYYDSDGIKQTATSIVAHWQQNLSAFINIEASDNLAVLHSELSSHSLPFAVFPIYARSTSPAEYLQNFGIGNASPSPENEQKALLDGSSLLPLAFQNTTLAYRSAITEIHHDSANGYIDFAYIIKDE